MVLSFRASSKSKAQQLAIEKKRKLIGELCGPICNTILRRCLYPAAVDLLYPAAADLLYPTLYPAAADLVSARRRQLRNSAAR